MGKNVKTPPKKWKFFWDTIKEMRADIQAPVDTMGCDKLIAPGANAKEARFQVLVALMLSSQTKDEITAGAMKRLQKLPLTIDHVLSEKEEKISDLIYPVGFYKKKAEHLKKVAVILYNEYDNDIPSTLEELQSLPGIGPKMAHLAMQHAWNKVEGIGVDVHVHRISNRLGWVKTTTPEKTRKELEDWLPKEYWADINGMFVGFGQKLCTSVKPHCGGCKLRNDCPSSTASDKMTDSNKKRDTNHDDKDNKDDKYDPLEEGQKSVIKKIDKLTKL